MIFPIKITIVIYKLFTDFLNYFGTVCFVLIVVFVLLLYFYPDDDPEVLSTIIKKGGKDVAGTKSCHAQFKHGESCHLRVWSGVRIVAKGNLA